MVEVGGLGTGGEERERENGVGRGALGPAERETDVGERENGGGRSERERKSLKG